MSDCLSEKELELLSNRQSAGGGPGTFNALKHLEECEKCRSQIKLPSKEEILSRIFDEDELAALRKSSAASTRRKS